MLGFSDTCKMLISAGLDELMVQSALESCCRYGKGTVIKAGRKKYRVNVLYNGRWEIGTKCWGLSLDNYLFDIWQE